VDKNWAVPGRFFKSLPVPYGTSGHDFYFFHGGGGGGVLGVLIGGSEKKHIVILCWGTHWEPKKNVKKPPPPPPPPGASSQNLKRIKARHLECTFGPSIGCMKFLFPKEFVTV
jgi:hypothetical protein